MSSMDSRRRILYLATTPTEKTPSQWKGRKGIVKLADLVAYRKRELRFTIFALATIGQFFLAMVTSSIPVPADEARDIVKQIPTSIDTLGIFKNNLLVALPTFTPGLGIGWLIIIMWNTGLAISSEAMLSTPPVPGWFSWVTISFFPFFWLEIMAYSVAATAGLMAFLTIVFDRKKLRGEASRFVLGLVLYALLLYNAAQAEYDTITTERMTPGTPIPLLGWGTNVAVGMVAILGFTLYRDIRVTRRDWSILLGLIAILLFLPFIYVISVLSFMAYLLWRNARNQNVGMTVAPTPLQ